MDAFDFGAAFLCFGVFHDEALFLLTTLTGFNLDTLAKGLVLVVVSTGLSVVVVSSSKCLLFLGALGTIGISGLTVVDGTKGLANCLKSK